MQETKFCPHCGAKLTTGTKFCPRCGYQVTDHQTAESATQQETTSNSTTRQTRSANQHEVSHRIDEMVGWVSQNWATVVISLVVIFIFTFVMDRLFYHLWWGLLALVGALVWLYSYATTHGTAPTNFESQLRHLNGPQQSSPKAKQAMVDPAAAAGSTSTNGGNTVYIQASPVQSNSLGLAGFILALVSVFTSWIPGIDFLIWFLGALFSFIGLFRQPRGFAIAGFIISFIGLILIVILLSLGIGLLGSLGAF